MKPLPLRLALEPLLPSRTPSTGGYFRYGFRLRLPGGPGLGANDPLLAAFGAGVEWIEVEPEHEEALQADSFEPGRVVRLVPEPFDPEDPHAIGVWDAEGLRQGGTLSGDAAAVVSAAAEAGLEQRGLVLWEHRDACDDRREHIALLVHAPALVSVKLPRNLRVERPVRRSRPRLVLVADESGELRWWDPSATSGPLEAGELPLSQELRHEFELLRAAFGALSRDEQETGFERLELDWERDSLAGRAAALWQRARSELGARYAVGFLGAGMRRPVWSPSELSDDDDEGGQAVETPF